MFTRRQGLLSVLLTAAVSSWMNRKPKHCLQQELCPCSAETTTGAPPSAIKQSYTWSNVLWLMRHENFNSRREEPPATPPLSNWARNAPECISEINIHLEHSSYYYLALTQHRLIFKTTRRIINARIHLPNQAINSRKWDKAIKGSVLQFLFTKICTWSDGICMHE